MARPIAFLGEALSKCLADVFSRDAWRRAAPALKLLTCIKLGLSLGLLTAGFCAISDDDFARVVIAQDFAASPKLDPSGTSWLPLPFFVTGLPMMVFGPSFTVARVVAMVCGVLAAWLVWVAARLLGASKSGALIGALVAAAFPYSAWLGVATVPELYTAALIVFAAACSAAAAPNMEERGVGTPPHALGLSLLGAAAVTAAAACRYEAWPVACGYAALCVRDALRSAQPRRALPALVALFFPLAWLAHGQYHYADPFFFVKRVAEYKAALGAEAPSMLTLVLGYPLALVRSEPELCLLTLVALLWRGTTLRWQRPFGLFALQLAVLIGGDVRGGAPTHHIERALVGVWLFMALLFGEAIAEPWARFRAVPARTTAQLAPRRDALTVLLGGLVLGACLLRPYWTRVGVFAPRQAELSLGQTARELLAPTERLLVATEDFGYFAVQAGFASPGRLAVFDRHNPRQVRPGAPHEAGPSALFTTAQREGIPWVAAPTAWLGRAAPRQVRLEVGPFALIRVAKAVPETAQR